MLRLHLKGLCFFVLALIFPTSLIAQNIKGKIVNELDEPLTYANIIALTTDSNFVAGVMSDSCGIFSLKESPEITYLKASYIGYSTQILPLSHSDVGTIKLNPDTSVLGEVVIKKILPKTKLEGDAFVTTVENSVLADAGSANDVLKKLPGVTQKGDGLEVLGKGTPQIYINGRLVRDNAELEALTSKDIKSVDVVTNPGARYDASVNAVIRIKTVKRQGDGLSFNLRSSWYQCEDTDLRETLNMNYRHNNLDVFASVDFAQTEGFQDTEIEQYLYSEKPLFLQQKANFTNNTQSLYTTLGVNYQLNEKHSFGIQYRPKFTLKGETFNDSRVTAKVDGVIDDFTHTLSEGGQKKLPIHQVNAYYNGTFGKLNIDFNADLLDSRFEEGMVYNEKSQLQVDRIVTTRSKEHNRLYASKLVLSHPFLGGQLSGGAEYAYTDRSDEYWNQNAQGPNSFTNIRENSADVFMDFTYPIKTFYLVLGMRYEYLAFNYFENHIKQEDQSREFGNFFPSVSLSGVLGDVQLQLGYTAKTSRPSYNQLSNASMYLDRYSYSKGNPYLKPELQHNASLAAVWKYFQFAANYKLTERPILHWGKQSETTENCIMLHYENFNRNIPELTVSLTASPTIGIWYPRFTGALFKQWFKGDFNGKRQRMNRPIPVFSWGNTLKLPKNFTAEVDYTFTGKGNQRIYQLDKPTHVLDVAIRKTFLNNALSLELKSTDLFKDRGDRVRMWSGDYMIKQKNIFGSREVVFTLRYKFNSTKSKYKGTGAGEQQKNRM